MSGCRHVYETARLALRLAAPSFAVALSEYYRRNRAFFSAFDPQREDAFFTEAEQRILLERDVELAREDRGYRFYLFLRGEPERLIGMVGLSNLVRGAFQSCHMGYKLDGELLCQGYMTEAVEGPPLALPSRIWGSTASRPILCPRTGHPSGWRKRPASTMRAWPSSI